MEPTTHTTESESTPELGHLAETTATAASLEVAKQIGADELDLTVEDVDTEILEQEKKDDGSTLYRVKVFELARPGPIEVKVTEDKLEAVIAVIQPELEPDKPVAEADIVEALKTADVVKGIIEDVLKSLPGQLKKINRPLRDVVVARGSPPVESSGGKLEYLFDKEAVAFEALDGGVDPAQFLSRPEQVAEDDPELGQVLDEVQEPTLKEIVYDIDPADINEMGYEFFAVGPGTPLMEIRGGREGRPGVDVLGQTIPSPNLEDIKFPEGENLKLSDDGRKLLSAVWGYLDFSDAGISVLSPVRVAPDKMVGRILYLPLREGSVMPKLEDLRTTLDTLGIKFGLAEDVLKKIAVYISRNPGETKLVPIAKGKAPINGEDSKLDFKVDILTKAGKVRKDGTLDYKERNVGQSIDKGVLLAEKIPLVYGVKGTDIFGHEVAAKDGQDLQIVLEDGVEDKGDGMKFYSNLVGRLVTVKKGDTQSLRISPIFEVKGNLDYQVGNISFQGDVDIKGSILAGFNVKAKGNILVSDVVEEGANVEAGGNIEIKQGVVGKELTYLKAGGSVNAKFLETVRVEADGNVEIDNFISNSTVVTSARVLVTKGKGSIIGGIISATEGIEVNTVGADLGNPTHLIVGVNQTVQKELTKLEDESQKINDKLDEIGKTLGPNVNLKNVAYLKRLSPEMRTKIINGLKTARELTARQEALAPKIKDLRSQLIKSNTEEPSLIAVNKMLHPKTTVTIRFQKRKINENLGKVIIYEDLEAKEITWKVMSG
jgi:uncharacterized protein (DUF342 family)